jgi:membrane protease YdiL (CAAX protease family)
MAESEKPPLPGFWTDRGLRVFELLLVCGIAFGGSILSSAYYFLFQGRPIDYGGDMAGNAYRWSYSLMHEIFSLALLWYVLVRRELSLSALGLNWEWKDILRSIGVWFGGLCAAYLVYWIIYLAGLTTQSQHASSQRVGEMIFGGGVSLLAALFLVVNPFFEELIVRAYLMTEIRQFAYSGAVAVFTSTALQTSYHFYQGAPMALSAGGFFLICSIYYVKTKRITPVILAHLYTDIFAALFYRPHSA